MISTNADESLRYGKIKISSKNAKHLSVEASGNQSATYIFHCWQEKNQNQKQRHRLKQVAYTHKPQIDYEYEIPFQGDENQPPLALLKRKTQGSLFQEVTYYQEGNNVVDCLREVRIAKDDFRIHRVKEIKAPVGHDATPVVTHRLVYLADHQGNGSSGKTEVYDAKMDKTVYAYNKEQRPHLYCTLLKEWRSLFEREFCLG